VSPYEELRLLLTTLGEGEQRSGEICPHCRGGRGGEGSLSITRFQGSSGAYKCNRASCAKEGYLGERVGTHYSPPVKAKEWQPRIYDGTIEQLPDSIIQQYTNKYGWSEEDLRAAGCGWSPEYYRTVWKIHSPTGALRGIELRTFNPQSRAKTLHFRHTSDEWVGYILRTGNEVSAERSGGSAGSGLIVAVEDLMSAYRVSQVYPAASIMGSHVNFDIMMDLMKVSENVVLVLDRDATAKAEKFAARFSFICPNLVHIPIQRDLKYERLDTIQEIVSQAVR